MLQNREKYMDAMEDMWADPAESLHRKAYIVDVKHFQKKKLNIEPQVPNPDPRTLNLPPRALSSERWAPKA